MGALIMINKEDMFDAYFGTDEDIEDIEDIEELTIDMLKGPSAGSTFINGVVDILTKLKDDIQPSSDSLIVEAKDDKTVETVDTDTNDTNDTNDSTNNGSHTHTNRFICPPQFDVDHIHPIDVGEEHRLQLRSTIQAARQIDLDRLQPQPALLRAQPGSVIPISDLGTHTHTPHFSDRSLTIIQVQQIVRLEIMSALKHLNLIGDNKNVGTNKT